VEFSRRVASQSAASTSAISASSCPAVDVVTPTLAVIRGAPRP
jgi:hypothetical protein